MDFKRIHTVYMIGIGGIGMSALARWFRHHGKVVSGYDKTKTPLTDQLELEGIAIHYEDDLEQIDSEVFTNSEASLIVYTPAIPDSHRELSFFRDNHFELYKRSEVLGEITKSNFTIAVAGTHGKTTTSSMIAHLLKSSGKCVTAFVGGIMANYNSNLVLSELAEEEEIIVVEADEYDRSFLKLHPDITVITSVAPDHLDIYGDGDEVIKTFRDFASVAPKRIVSSHAMDQLALLEGTTVYGLEKGELSAPNINAIDGAFQFETAGAMSIDQLTLCLPGNHNVENALAAIAVSNQFGITEDDIKIGLASYQGVRRRFEFILKTESFVLIDDYAHHPEEISAFLNGVKALYNNRNITVVFQPHLYTRTRDFAEGFGESLSLADRVVLLDIYPARELPIPGVTSELVLHTVDVEDKQIVGKEDLIEVLLQQDSGVICTVGAGDIDQLVLPIKKALENELVKA